MSLTDFAKKLRKDSTNVEMILWRHLRAKRLGGFKFRRQEPIRKYIVDFVCHEKSVIVECDGGQHRADPIKDRERDQWFAGQGYCVLRFWNNDILQNLEGVLKTILETCQTAPSPCPPERTSLSHKGRGHKE